MITAYSGDAMYARTALRVISAFAQESGKYRPVVLEAKATLILEDAKRRSSFC